MGQKKKTSSTRKATYAKAGDKRRKPYTPVMRKVVRRKRQSPQVIEGKENTANMRRGPGSNREDAYTGYPLSYFK